MKKININDLWLGNTLFRCITAILFIFTVGKELERNGFKENIVLSIYGLTMIIWVILPIYNQIIQTMEDKK